MKYFGIAIGLIIGNFVYQGLHAQPDWSAALDRSYWMSFTVLVCWLVP